MSHARSLLLSAVMACSLVPRAAAAAAPQRIVVVSDSEDTTLIPLLRGELNQLGLEVIDVRAQANEEIGQTLAKTARDYTAVAAFRVRISSHTIEVWIADRATGNVALREVFSQNPQSSDEARLVVLQAVELVRWSLKDTEPRAKPSPRTPVPSEAPVVAGASGSRRRVTLSAAPYALLSPGGASPGAGAQLDLAFAWSWVGTRFSYAQPIFQASIQRDISRADIASRWLAVEMLLEGSSAKPIRPSLGVGAAMVLTTLHGVAPAPRGTNDDRLVTVAPIADGRLGFSLAPRLCGFAGLSVLVPFRSDNIVFEGNSAGTYGKVMATVMAGIEASLL